MGNELDPLVRDRLAEGIQQLKDGKGVDRPEFTRFDIGATLEETITDVVGGVAVNQTIED